MNLSSNGFANTSDMTEFSSPRIKTITIVTPCYNAEKYIEETVKSVINNSVFQTGCAKLEYFICDGGSVDNTCNIVRNIMLQASDTNIRMDLISEKDHGMYDALAKGLRNATGDICAYINAGDFYSPTAFEIVIDVFRQENINWLTGLQVRYNERSHLLSANLPYKFRKSLIQCGAYGSKLPFIQQESTFWDQKFNCLLDFECLSKFRYAGDFFMWKSFANYGPLYIVEAWLGGFKSHQNQLSTNIEAYRTEMNGVALAPTSHDKLLSCIDKIIWYSPNRVKRFLNKDTLFSFNFEMQQFALRTVDA